MSGSRRRGVWIAAVVTIAAGIFAFYWTSRTKLSTPVEAAKSTPHDTPKERVEEALRDASLLDLIRNARVATRNGDSVTRTAMLNGLKKEPARAKSLIQREIARAKDPTDQAILTRIESELP